MNFTVTLGDRLTITIDDSDVMPYVKVKFGKSMLTYYTKMKVLLQDIDYSDRYDETTENAHLNMLINGEIYFLEIPDDLAGYVKFIVAMTILMYINLMKDKIDDPTLTEFIKFFFLSHKYAAFTAGHGFGFYTIRHFE